MTSDSTTHVLLAFIAFQLFIIMSVLMVSSLGMREDMRKLMQEKRSRDDAIPNFV